MRRILGIVILAFLGLPLLAQNRTLTGRVQDESGNPIAQATIQVDKSKIVTTSGENGSFSLSLPPNARMLVVSAIGWTTQDVVIGNQSSLTIVLGLHTGSLEQVVVTGVGTATSKRKVAISVESVSGKDLSKI